MDRPRGRDRRRLARANHGSRRMSLDPSYLDYPRRRRGMDHDLYPWSNLFERPPNARPGGAAVAVLPVLRLERFLITPSDPPFRAPGPLPTADPYLPHNTATQYRPRIGLSPPHSPPAPHP